MQRVGGHILLTEDEYQTLLQDIAVLKGELKEALGWEDRLRREKDVLKRDIVELKADRDDARRRARAWRAKYETPCKVAGRKDPAVPEDSGHVPDSD